MKRFCRSLVASALLTGCVAGVANATTLSEEERESAKEALVAAVDKQTKLAQVMNDMIFSFGELGLTSPHSNFLYLERWRLSMRVSESLRFCSLK